VKPLADFEPSRSRVCGISESCHSCLTSAREERAAVELIIEESAERMLEIQYRPTPMPETPLERPLRTEVRTDEYFRQVDATRRRRRLQRRK
jgi:hypothetical protein